MLQNLTQEVHRITRAERTLPWIGAIGLDARLPVADGLMVATIVANTMGDRNVWSATAFAFCNAGEALLTAWLIERYFGTCFSLDRPPNVLGLVAAAVVA